MDTGAHDTEAHGPTQRRGAPAEEPTRKGYRTGTHRTRSPRETVEDYLRLAPRFGITRLANVTGLDVLGLPVYVCVRPNSRGLSVSQGKGFDRDSARASALMESIESWHAERVQLPMRFESYLSLRESEPVVDVTALPLRRGAVLRLDQPMLFVRGEELMKSGRGRDVWVPYEAVTTNFVTTSRVGYTFLMTSNGLASGNTHLEAIDHAICELIERDALTLWQIEPDSSNKARQIDLDTAGDPCCRDVLDRLARSGVRAAAWDITSDVGVPAYCAALFDCSDRPRWRRMGMFSGYGCHPSPAVALMRALSEAVQSRLTMIAGSRDDLFYRDYVHCTNEDDFRVMLASATTPPPALDFGSRAPMDTDTFDGDRDALLARLEGAGIESAVAVDLSLHDVGIPVVKVVIPGLEAMSLSSSYAPGMRARRKRAAIEAERAGRGVAR